MEPKNTTVNIGGKEHLEMKLYCAQKGNVAMRFFVEQAVKEKMVREPLE